MKITKTKKDAIQAIKSHTKGISAILVSYGVAEIMGNVMKEYKPDAKGIKKVFIKIGALALTGAVIKYVTDYTDSQIDEVFDIAQEAVDKNRAKKPEDLTEDDANEADD